MKKFLLFSLVIAAVAISSCKRDDDPEPVSPIVGTWHLTEILVTNAPSNYQNYVGMSFAPASFDIFAEMIIIGTGVNFVVKRNNIEYEPIEIDNNGSISLVWGGSIDTFEGTYQFLNNELTLNYVNDPSEIYAFNEDGTLTRSVPLSIFTTRWIYRKF
jgi:hypothetical protein